MENQYKNTQGMSNDVTPGPTGAGGSFSTPQTVFQPVATPPSPPITEYEAPIIPEASSLESLPVTQPQVPSAIEVPSSGPGALPPVKRPGLNKAFWVISGVAAVIVLGVAITAGVISKKNTSKLQSPAKSVSEQGITLGTASPDVLSVLQLKGSDNKLIVNGDIITTGRLSLAAGTAYGQFVANNLSTNREYILPDASGTLCLDSNNCNYAKAGTTVGSVNGVTGALTLGAGLGLQGTTIVNTVSSTTIEGQTGNFNLGAGLSLSGTTIFNSQIQTTLNNASGAITLQGTANQIDVAIAGNTITLSTPQDIDIASSPTFNGLTVASLTVTGGNASLNGIAYTLPSLQGSGVLANDGFGGLTWVPVGGACPTCFLNNGNSFATTAVLGTNDNNNLVFETNNTTRLTIDTNGNVGIGAASPGERLYVPWLSGDTAPTAGFGSSNAGNNQIAVLGSSNSNIGVVGTSQSDWGVMGQTAGDGTGGVSGFGSGGVIGMATSATNSYGILGLGTIFGGGNNIGVGAFGSSYGLYAQSTDSSAIFAKGGCSGLFVCVPNTAPIAVLQQYSDVTTNDFLQAQLNNGNIRFRINSDGGIELGESAASAGTIVFNNASNANTLTLNTTVPTGNNTISFPDASGVVCLTSGNCAGVGAGDILNNGNTFGAAVTLGSNDNFALNFETNGTNRMTISNTGDVSILNDLDITDHLAVGSNASVDADTIVRISEINTNLSGGAKGISTDLYLNAASNSSVSAAATESNTTLQGAGINYTGLVAGSTSGLNNDSTGTVTNGVGSFGFVNNRSTGTITAALGAGGVILNTAGGTITTAASLQGGVGNTGAGTISTAIGLLIASTQNTGGGTVGTNYGIKVDNQSAGASDYGVRIDAADTQTLWLSGDADNTTASAGIAFGSSRDTNLYRSAVATLKTDGNFTVAGGVINLGVASSATGSTVFYNSGGSGSITLSGANPGASTYAITLPNASGTVCLTSGNCAGVGGTGDILNNGNSFGTAVVLGTNDSNLLQFETGGTTRATIDTSGRFGLNTSTFGTNNQLLVNQYNTVDNLATAQISTTAATNKGLVVQGFASQTANLTEWQNSSGTVLASINSSGNLTIGTTAASTGAIRLANNTSIMWRNAANSADIDGIAVNSGNQLVINNGGSASAGVLINNFTAFGTGGSQATTGDIRLNNNANVAWRNAANTGNITFGVNSSDILASSTAISIGANPSTNGDLRLKNGGNIGARNAANTANLAVLSTTTSDVVQIAAAVTTNDATATASIGTTGTAKKGLIIQGVASQTANLQEWQDSAGTILASVSSGGTATFGSSTSSANLNVIGAGTNGIFLQDRADSNLTKASFTIGSDAGYMRLYRTGSTVAVQLSADASVTNYINNGGAFAVGTTTAAGTVQKLGINAYTTVDNLANVILAADAATSKPLVIQGAASQSAVLTQWQNSAGTGLLAVTASGGIVSASSSTGFIYGGAGGYAIETGNNKRIGVSSGGGAEIVMDNTTMQINPYGSLTFASQLGSGNAKFNLPVLVNSSGGTPGTVEKFRVNTPTTTDNLAASIFSTGATTSKGLVIQGVASQSAYLLELQNSTGAAIAGFTAAGGVSISDSAGAISGTLTSNSGNLIATSWNSLWTNSIRSSSGNLALTDATQELTWSSSGVTIPVKLAVAGASLSTVEKLGVNAYTTADTAANVIFSASATGAKPLVVQGLAGQTANLFEAQTSTGATVATIGPSGSAAFGATSSGAASLSVYSGGASSIINVRDSANGNAVVFGVHITGDQGVLTLGSNASDYNNGSVRISGVSGLTSYFNNGAALGVGTATVAGTVQKLGVNTYTTVDNAAATILATGGTGNKGLVVQGAAAQTANLQEWQNSSGTQLAAVDASGRFVATTLGSADTSTYLCRNASNQIATCSGTATGSAFVQNGNSFGGIATLGTNDSFDLNFETGGTTKAALDTSGRLGIGITSSIPAKLTVAGSADETQFIVRTHSTQTSDIVKIQNSTGSSTYIQINSAGQLQFGSATANATTPSLTGASTSGTGIYFAATGQVNFATTSAERLRIAMDTTNTDLLAQSGNNLRLGTSASGVSCTISNTNGSLSCPGTGGSSERFGSAAIAGGNSSLAVGNGASAGTTGAQDNNTAIGKSATTGTSFDATALGSGASAGGQRATALGKGTTASSTGSIAIGADANSNQLGSIVLGYGATTSAANQFVVGSSGSTVTNGYFGGGVTAASPTGFTLNATGGSGSNVAGASLQLAGGIGTGSGNGGNINLQVAKPGTSGSSANSLATVVTISGNNGSALFQNSANSTQAFRVANAAGTVLEAYNTLTSGLNLIANSSFEQSSNGWSAKGAAAITNDDTASNANFGSRTLSILTGTNANDGASYRFPFAASTTYAVSFYAKLSTGSSSNISFGRADNGSDTDCLTSQTLTTTWTQYTCSFTTGATIGSSANFYIKQSDATVKTIYIDGVTLVAGSTALAYTAPGQQLQVDAFQSQITLNGNLSGETGAWQGNTSSLPASVYGNGTATYNGYMYSVGGYSATANGSAATANIYYAKINADGSTGAWSTNTNTLPAARGEFGNAVVVNGFLYVVGGRATNNGASTSTVYYARLNADGSTGVWQTSNYSLTAGKAGHVTFTANGYLYVASGNAAATYYAKLNADGSTGQWQTGNTTAARPNPAVVVANNIAYIIGGSTTNSVITTVLNPTDGSNGASTTLSTPTLPANRQFHSAALINGYMYVIGGSTNGTTNANNTVYYAKVNGDGTLGTFQTSTYALPLSLYGQASIATNGYIYSLGGTNGTSGATVYSNIYYASTARLLVGGSLDLVGLSSQNLVDAAGSDPSGSIGGSLTAGNTRILGTLDVQSNSNFLSNVTVEKSLRVNTDAIIKNSNITSNNQVGTVAIANMLDIWVQGRYAYGVASTSNTLQVIDITDPTNPTTSGMGSVSLTGTAIAIHVSGKYAYVLTSSRMQVIDISNPNAPVVTGSVLTSGGTSGGLYVQGKYVYASVGSGNLDVYDVSDPTTPVIATTFSITGSSQNEVFVQGNYLYAVLGAKLYVVDITNPTAPVNKGNVTVGGSAATSVYVKGRYAYVGETGNKFEIIDISNPSTPAITKSLTAAAATITSVWVQGQYAYVGGNSTSNGLQVFDVTTPANAYAVTGGVTIGNSVQAVQAVGQYAYLNANGNLRVWYLGGAYVQQLSAGGIDASTINTDSNISSGGSLSVQGSGTFSAGLNVQGASSFTSSDTTSLNVTTKSTTTTAGTLQGQYTNVSDTGVVTTGTDNTYGSQVSVTRAGATGGTINTYGLYSTVNADNAGAGTANVYGVYGLVGQSGTMADNAYGGYFKVFGVPTTTTVTSTEGVHAEVTLSSLAGNTATYTDAYAIRASVSSLTGGGFFGTANATNVYGIQVDASSALTSGTINNNYGIKVGAQTVGTADYGVAIEAVDNTAGNVTLWVSSNADNTNKEAGIAFGSSKDTSLYRSGAASLATNATTLSLSGASGTINTTGTNAAITLQSNGSGTATFDSGTTGNVDIGTGANAKTVTIGNATGATDVNVNLGSGVFNVTNTAADANNVAQFNNAGATSCTVQPGGTGFACSSDARLKTNVVTIGDALDLVKQLRGVNFNWISDPNGQTQSGFIAQELEQLIPNAVSTDSNGYKVANYTAIIPYLVGAAQQQDIQITGLQQSQTATTGNLTTTDSKVTNLEQRVAALEAAQPQGNNSNFTNLNVSGMATIQNLTVTGSATIAQLTVTGDAHIAGNLLIDGHVLGNQDTRGEVVIPAGQTSVKTTFRTPYGKKPFVVASPVDKPILFSVTTNPTDFTIIITNPEPTDTTFNFMVQE